MILNDTYHRVLSPLLQRKPAFALRTGIFSDLERALLKNEELIIHTGNPEKNREFYELYFKTHKINSDYKVLKTEAEPLDPVSLISGFTEKLERDISLLEANRYKRGGYRFSVIGADSDLWVGENCSISPTVEIDVTDGPVIIEHDVSITAFSYLKGPVYIGAGSSLDRVSLSETVTGRICRLGGEISDSLIGDYTNKHHEGFTGHSLLGDWVNLGALTTTSDLKNNYGEVRLQFETDEPFNTGTVKFGSIIGDYAKTAIGTMLNTGTIIDFGALLFEGHGGRKYYPPFFWGGSETAIYREDRFIADIEKIMKRRESTPDAVDLHAVKSLYQKIYSV